MLQICNNAFLVSLLMKFFEKGYDGGKNSGVTGYWLIELKGWFSICLLHFAGGTRENYHSHAFNALTWFLWGSVIEQHVNEEPLKWGPSLKPKWTPRSIFHRVQALHDTWALTFRGPWSNTWYEYDPHDKKYIQMTHGRNIIDQTDQYPISF